MAIPEYVESQWYHALFEEDCIVVMELLHAHPNLLKVGWESDPERQMKGSARSERYGGSEKIRSTWKGRSALHVAARRGCARLVMQVLSLCKLSESFSYLERGYRQTLRLDKELSFSKIHYGHSCDDCTISPIVGIRWQSVDNSNYNLCPVCYKKKQNKKQFIKIDCVVGAQTFVYPEPASSIDNSDEEEEEATEVESSIDSSEEEASDEEASDEEASDEEAPVEPPAGQSEIVEVERHEEKAPLNTRDSSHRHARLQAARKRLTSPADVETEKDQIVVDLDVKDLLFATDEECGLNAVAIAALHGNKVIMKMIEYGNNCKQSARLRVGGSLRASRAVLELATANDDERIRLRQATIEVGRQYFEQLEEYYKHRAFNFLPPEEYLFHYMFAVKGLTWVAPLRALWQAVRSCKGEVWRFLLQLKDGQGRPPFHVAMQESHASDFLSIVEPSYRYVEDRDESFSEESEHEDMTFISERSVDVDSEHEDMTFISERSVDVDFSNIHREGEVKADIFYGSNIKSVRREGEVKAVSRKNRVHYTKSVRREGEVKAVSRKNRVNSPLLNIIKPKQMELNIIKSKQMELNQMDISKANWVLDRHKQMGIVFRKKQMELEIVRKLWRAAFLRYGLANAPNNDKVEDDSLTTKAGDAEGISSSFSRQERTEAVAKMQAELESLGTIGIDGFEGDISTRKIGEVVARVEAQLEGMGFNVIHEFEDDSSTKTWPGEEAGVARMRHLQTVAKEMQIQILAAVKEKNTENARNEWAAAFLKGVSRTKRERIIAKEKRMKWIANMAQKRMEAARNKERQAFLRNGVGELKANITTFIPSDDAWPAGPIIDESDQALLCALTSPDAVGRTPVHNAAAMGLVDALKCLLQRAEDYPEVADTFNVSWNASPEAKDIYQASRNEYPDWEFAIYTDFLLKAQLPRTPLHAAMIHGNFDCAELLMRNRGLFEEDKTYRFLDEELIREIIGAIKLPPGRHKTAWGQRYTAWIGLDMLELACLVGAPIEFVAVLMEFLKVWGREPLFIDELKAQTTEREKQNENEMEESEDGTEESYRDREESEEEEVLSENPIGKSDRRIEKRRIKIEKRKIEVEETKGKMKKLPLVLKHLWHPLHLAASTGRYDLVEYFLEDCHFNPFLGDFEGNSALHHAMKVREIVVKTHLYDYVSCEHINLSRQSALRMAMKHILEDNSIAQRHGCINRLLQVGCNVFKVNKKNQLPYPRKSLKNAKFLSWWYGKQQEEFKAIQGNFNFATSAIAVTAALVATSAYVGPLQPPMGYDANQIQYENVWVSIFIVCDTISFYFAIVAIMLSLIPSLPMPEQGMLEELQRTQGMVIAAVAFLLPSIFFVFIAFASSSISVMSANVTTEVGGIFTIFTTSIGVILCVVVFILFIIRLLAFVYPRNNAIRAMYNASNQFTKLIK